jgi:PTH1 family peptidyl-tRNA hydrolase
MADNTRVIAGLGNPGPEYRGHRHNVGFRTVEGLAEQFGWSWTDVGDFAWAGGERDAGPVVLLKPLTYMNRSGQALLAWAAQASVELSGAPHPDPSLEDSEGETAPADTAIRPLVVCDDLNLPLGSVRLRARGRSGGQNGLLSVIEELGGAEFPRLRLGVAPVGTPVDPADWADFVLRDFDPDETQDSGEMIGHGVKTLACWLEDGFEAAVSRFNRRIRPETE